MHGARVGLLGLLFLASIFLAPSRAQANGVPAWTLDGVAISTAYGYDVYPAIASDGKTGGAIITWMHASNGNRLDIYAQRVNVTGVPQWTANGVAICTAADARYNPQLVSDGLGGAIITWSDRRDGTQYDIYAQRVSASGLPQWTTDGVAVCTEAGDQVVPRIVPDGVGGAIVAWENSSGGCNAQRVNASGVPQWAAGGVVLSPARCSIVADGAGGVIAAWSDDRNGNNDVYAQRLNTAGVPQWTVGGVAVCVAAHDQQASVIATDGAGGAIITWLDVDPDDYDHDIHAQRVGAAGTTLWNAGGVALCTAADDQTSATIAPDGLGGAIVAWQDERSGTNDDVYAQRVDAAGVPLWAANGTALCTAVGDQYYPQIVSTDQNGAIVTWQDERSGTYDIYAQRVSNAGVPAWTADGVALCTATNWQARPRIVSDRLGGAIVAWEDMRGGSYPDIYAQRVVDGVGP